MYNFNNSEPIYIQIAHNIFSKIMVKEIPLGSMIQSVRDLAKEYIVTPKTIQNATKYLMDIKVIEKDENNRLVVTEDFEILEKSKIELINKIKIEYKDKLASLGIKLEEGGDFNV